MTEIHTNVQRKTRWSYTVLTRKARHIVVALQPGDVLSFRELGCRARFELPIHEVFMIAVRKKVEADRRAKREARKGAAA